MLKNNKIKLFIADDQPIIIQGLRYIINTQNDMEVVGDATNGEEVIKKVLKTSPDVVLMDIQMPNRSGIESTHIILNTLPNVKIVLLTTFDVQEYVFDGIRAGAVGYLLKDTDTKELLDSIRWVYQGQAIYRTTTASKALAQALINNTTSKTENDKQLDLPEPLTDREIDVLQQMAYGRRNSEISNIFNISEGTVKTHVHRIIQKLGAYDRTQAVVFAIRQHIVK
ncbi:response regulator transcription factor [Clostridium felsineum]|uniref:Stage 0 sporulation protein A homolog n=1 Tax=Clostridium felsineum TaxID=36839 RepID=A0A1S8L0Z6_9CLOT|nr:response regulator transcription factor [Clostridium felsineum]URZ05557.1 Transcriptional regulatory protein LnrK [Clostridium felsineum]URZ10596.1 Transcriptional regulatory protein LnrK [Clostridium felsineum]